MNEKELSIALRTRRRNEAETRFGRIVGGALPGGQEYNVRLSTGETVRASRGQFGNLVNEQAVTLSTPDGSGLSSNTGYTIISATPVRGASANPAVVTTANRSAGVITYVTPDPVTMRGGETKTVTVYGAGFTASTPVTFGTNELSHASPPDITATQITLQAAAAEGATPGRYALTVGDATRANVFEVTPTAPRLWVGANSAQTAWKINPATAATMLAVSLGSEGIAAQILIPAGDYVYAFGHSFGNGKLVRITRATGTKTVVATGYLNGDLHSGGTFDGTNLWWADGSRNVRKVNPATGAVLASIPDGSLIGGVFRGLHFDGTYVWTAYGGGKVMRITPTTNATADVSGIVGSPGGLADDGAYLYCATYNGAPNGRVLKIDKASMAVVASLAGFNFCFGIAHLDGFLYVIDETGTGSYGGFGDVVKINASTMTETARLIRYGYVSGAEGGIVTDGSLVWVLRNWNGFQPSAVGICAINPATMTQTMFGAIGSGTSQNLSTLKYA